MKIMKTKILTLTILFSLLVFTIYSEEIELAKFYLKKALYYYQDNNKDLSKQFLQKSFGYSNKFPEYYYISNLILSNNKTNMALKKFNANMIIKNLDNSFLIGRYELLKQACLIFERIRDFNKSIEFFERFLSISNRNLEDDYINYIEMLFKSNNKANYNLIPEIIKRAKKLYASLHFDYYLILYKIKFKNIKEN